MNPKTKTTSIAARTAQAVKTQLSPLAKRAEMEKLFDDPRYRSLPEAIREIASKLSASTLKELLEKLGDKPGATPGERVQNAREGSTLATMGERVGIRASAAPKQPHTTRGGTFVLPTRTPSAVRAASKGAR